MSVFISPNTVSLLDGRTDSGILCGEVTDVGGTEGSNTAVNASGKP